MKKTINFLQNSAIFNDRTEFVVAENDVLEIEIPNKYPQARIYLLGELNGNFFTLLAKENKVVISNDKLETGLLKLVIEIREGDLVVKRFTLEPLKIKKLAIGKEIIPEIEQLKREIENIKGYKAEVEKYLKLLGNLYNVNLKIGGEKWFSY